MMDTIFALAAASGPAGVAVVRISGAKALYSLTVLTDLKMPLTPRHAYFKNLVFEKQIIDQVVILYFKAPYSFTGEDCVEFHIHGSPAILKYLYTILGSFENYRLAEPGEFTKRAFHNNKIDLIEAEAIHDLIFSETEYQREQAMGQYQGQHSALYQQWREKILNILAECETEIDFVEDDIPLNLVEKNKEKVKILTQEIDEFLDDKNFGERLREGFKVALVGPPNVGKSSLLNLLINRQAAIISHKAGTTRDIIEVNVNLSGYPIILADMAGLRQTNDDIEKQGIEKAKEWIEKADIILYLGAPDNTDFPKFKASHYIYIMNKYDLMKEKNLTHTQCDLYISVIQSYNIDALKEMMIEKIIQMKKPTQSFFLSNQRHRHHLKNALYSLKSSLNNKMIELAIEDLRLAARELGKITGKIDIEEILGRIFSNFCIGK